jgi:predicted SAM-dependent methyltransferase
VSDLYLNAACGQRPLPSPWWNFDLQQYPGVDYTGRHFIQRDLREGFGELPPGEIREIRADQFIEHLAVEDGLRFLAHCRALLRPGHGMLQLSCPDIEAHFHDFLEGQQRVPAPHPTHTSGLFTPEQNLTVRILYDWGHRMIYSAAMLRRLLDHAGFEVLRLDRPDGANLVATATPRE